MMNNSCTCSAAFRDQYPDPTTHLWHCNIWGPIPCAYDQALDRVSGDRDEINHPSHYTAGGVETIDFIEAKNLGYHLGNVIKYVSRAGKKSASQIKDLEKARWYLDRHISKVRGAQ